jgi:hypothetical protein
MRGTEVSQRPGLYCHNNKPVNALGLVPGLLRDNYLLGGSSVVDRSGVIYLNTPQKCFQDIPSVWIGRLVACSRESFFRRFEARGTD